MDKSSVQIMTSAIHVAARIADYYDGEPPRYEVCCGCNEPHRLVKVAGVYIQPRHNCNRGVKL